ncbi:MAG: hypothetical protein AAGF93_13835 [Cyanobacteria bacterium P01_H01_bin.105]
MGVAARDHLRALVDKGEGGQIIVVPLEKDRYGRTVANLFIDLGNEEEIHLNSQMVMDVAWPTTMRDIPIAARSHLF